MGLCTYSENTRRYMVRCYQNFLCHDSRINIKIDLRNFKLEGDYIISVLAFPKVYQKADIAVPLLDERHWKSNTDRCGYLLLGPTFAQRWQERL